MNLKKITSNSTRWDIYSLFLIIVVVILNLVRWKLLPTFIDIYYHLSVVKGFHEAGGYVTSAFWEYAPFGRPHLYPPLMHILMFLLKEAGFDLVLIAKIFEFTIFPVFLLSLWYVIKNTFSKRLTFFVILISSSCYSFYLSGGNLVPSTLALIFGLFAFYYAEKEKPIASSIFLAFSFYSHASFSYYILLSLLVYCFLNRNKIKTYFLSFLLGLLIACPILIHQINNLNYITLQQVAENFALEINLLIYAAAILGFFIALESKGRAYIFTSFAVVMVPFIFLYPYRFLSGLGMTAIILLGALPFEAFYERIKKYSIKRPDNQQLPIYLIFVFLAFFVFSPSFYYFNNKIGILPLNSTYTNFIIRQPQITRANELTVYYPQSWSEAAQIINDKFEKGDIIFANGNYVAGVVSVYSAHATSTAMLSEIKPYKQIDPLKVSKIIVWFKNPYSDTRQKLNRLIERYNLEYVAETDFLYIYKNPDVKIKADIFKALVPTKVLFLILSCLVAILGWDILRE